MRLKPEQFQYRFGVRRRDELTSPRLIPQSKLELPLTSIYHFRPDQSAALGPNPQDAFYQSFDRVFIEHVTALASTQGRPRRTVFNPVNMEAEYRRKNRFFKPLRRDEALTINPRNLLVENYAFLPGLYRYLDHYQSNYYRWLNQSYTFWQHVEELQGRFNWSQFVDLNLPQGVPTRSQLQRLAAGVTQDAMRVFNQESSLDIFDLWVWLGEEREKSNLAQLGKQTLKNVNFIVRLRGYFFILNLGVLDEWRKDPNSDEQQSNVLDGSVLQRYFLVLLHGLQDFQAGLTTPKAPQEDTTLAESSDDEPLEEETTDTASTTSGLDLPGIDHLLLPDPASERPIPPDMDRLEQGQTLPEPTLDNLNTIEEANGDLIQVTVEQSSPVFGIARKAGELNDAGILTQAAYQRSLDDGGRYQTLKDPYGSDQTIAERLVITEEDLALPDTRAFKDRDTVIDKSMLQSKLAGLQRKYLRNVLQKDVLNSVMSIQNQGIAVTDYQIERVEDVMNRYDLHTVTLKPVRGRQSTVRFRLPVVDDDGRFISNGVTYKMRPQKADVPIRKVNPTRVALTSYYNKTFVDRSSRVVNNLGRWLTRQVVSAGLDPNNTTVTGIRLGNVFDSELDLPRGYSMFAQVAQGFTTNGFEFYFNYPKRGEYFGEEALAQETDQLTVVGRSGRQWIYINAQDVLYRYGPEGMELLGTFHDALGLDLTKAPVEMVEMSVSNKQLPVGIVLAYHMGLSELLKTLNCDVSRVARGTRLSLTSDQYALIFEDETLILSRLDTRAAMLLSGFNRFNHTIKRFSIWAFDQKDVYYRLLEDVGMGVRYLREMDTLFQAWVDPITKGLLETMGEPTSFAPLLIRATELLQVDWSPKETDGQYMRYRGYERMAGFVYSQLTRSAKIFNNRANVGELTVDLNPHEIWQNIVQDPTVSPVEDSNPVQNLREQEVTTYRGDGGRSGRSMVKRTRVFHESDMGVVSESTVDSGDVAVVAYLAPDANLVSLRGDTRRYNADTDGPSRLLSTSALLAPAADHDDQTVKLNIIR